MLKDAVLKGSRNPEDYFNYLQDKVEPLCPNDVTDAPYVHLSTIKGETAYDESKPEYRFKRVPGSRWNNALIRGIHASNIAIIGDEGSVIDGSNCYDSIGEENYRGPHGITLFDCENIRLSGYTIQNTGNWAHNLLFCNNIRVNRITVLAGHDGFDAAVCNNLQIEESEFYTGDDCIAGFGNINTYVNNCILNSSCSALRFGGSNVLIENCRIYGPGRYCFRGSLTEQEKRDSAPSVTEGKRNNMLSAFTYYADYSLPIKTVPGNIVLSNCQIEQADRFLHYNYSGNETWQKNRPLDNIEFREIKANGISMPITAYGAVERKLSIKFQNVDLSMREGSENIDLIHICNFRELVLDNVNITRFKGDCLIRTWSDGEISMNQVRCEETGSDLTTKIKKAEQSFCASAI